MRTVLVDGPGATLQGNADSTLMYNDTMNIKTIME
jgi:hypothetical protein